MWLVAIVLDTAALALRKATLTYHLSQILFFYFADIWFFLEIFKNLRPHKAQLCLLTLNASETSKPYDC